MTLDEKLAKAKENVVRKERLEAVLPSLRRQYDVLNEKVERLDKAKRKEQKDVEFYEGGSFAAFFYGITGKKEEKLEKERKEALEAAVKYDVAAKELEAVRARIEQGEAELAALAGCAAEYETLLAEKRQKLVTCGAPVAEEIERAERALFEADKQAVELAEAIAEGNKAAALVREVLDELDSAENWGLYDAFGGGMFSTMMKYDELDSAQEKVEELQVQLRAFQTELTDVRVNAEIRVEIGEFLRFADYFFDGFLADFSVMERIEEAVKQAEGTREKIAEVLQQLNRLEQENEKRRESCKEQLERLITAAGV